MKPGIEQLDEKKLVGMRASMSFTDNRTSDLWRKFMPGRNEILNVAGSGLYSVELYPPGYYDQFNPAAVFWKWACMEVKEFLPLPPGMESLILPAGLYAVFIHKGPATDGPKTYGYIFREWLPSSGFLLDDRPHFAVMGEKYRKDDPASEEEIWIPIRPK